MSRLFVVVLALSTLVAVTACGHDHPPKDHCAAALRRDVDWHNCDLTGVPFALADLTGADLSGANLLRTNLGLANLTGADLTGANLIQAKLGMTNLSGADLTGADLIGADMAFVDLTNADLTGVDLTGARLGATLTGANLTGADLTGADFSVLSELLRAVPQVPGSSDVPSNTTGIRYANTTCPDGTVVPPGTCW